MTVSSSRWTKRKGSERGIGLETYSSKGPVYGREEGMISSKSRKKKGEERERGKEEEKRVS